MGNFGKIVEDEMVYALNEQKYKNLSNNLKTFIRDMFGPVKDREIIYCSKIDGRFKPDIVVSIKHRKPKYVSIKSGRATTVHGENIKEVVLFLRSLGVSRESQRLLLLYQYGDGTLDGTGKVRKDYHSTYDWLQDGIRSFNEEINSDMEIKFQILERMLFQGVSDAAPKATYIYHGDITYGEVVSRTQILQYLKRKSFDFYENIHTGPLLIRPHARYSDTEIKNDELRHRIDFYWPKLGEDIHYIYTRFDKTYD